ncbi:hypothetical protein ACGF12_34210 [Kitasatospora sp. NPDC048296]|uniref:hypothetical protein n=1 Tax=Kitasatospora sp. NPDC048296 TaxID=3364048 RepID=UPI00371C49ED
MATASALVIAGAAPAGAADVSSPANGAWSLSAASVPDPADGGLPEVTVPGDINGGGFLNAETVPDPADGSAPDADVAPDAPVTPDDVTPDAPDVPDAPGSASIPDPSDPVAAAAAAKAAVVHARTQANTMCTGTWTHPVSTVQFQRARGGTLAWSFKLSGAAKSALGPVVTVTMPYSYVNGRAINPPYGPHTQPNWYNYHGSLNGFQFIGGGGGTIRTGNKVTFYWYLKGSKPNTAADRYITCQVPTPGSA